MKKIFLSLVALSALSGAAFANHGYSHSARSDHEVNRGQQNYETPMRHIKIVPTAETVDSSFEVMPATEKTLDQREIRRIDEKNHGR